MNSLQDELDLANKNLADAQRKVSKLEKLLDSEVDLTELIRIKVEQAAMLSMIAIERNMNLDGTNDNHRFEDLEAEIALMNKH